MRNFNTVHWMLLLALAIIIIIIHSGTVDSDVGEGRGHESRWARVDLTQYCDETIGDLIDALGGYHEKIGFLEEPTNFLVGFAFLYDNSFIRLYPNEFRFCQRNFEMAPWKYEDISRETIGRIRIEIFAGNSPNQDSSSTNVIDSNDFTIDYSKYIGWTIDSTLQDIGFKVERSYVMYSLSFPYKADSTEYIGCSFTFTNGVRISFEFDQLISHPPNIKTRIIDADYFMDRRIGKIDVDISCSKGL